MKKVLFATTALVATAGVAAADVAISGYAEMGLVGGDVLDTGSIVSRETQFHQDIDVTFSLSGTTDNGLTFGAAVDIDERSAGSDPADDDGVAVFISGNFGTLTMGDTDGALDWALTEAAVGNAGSIADNETSHIGYLGSYADGAYDGQVLRYDYSFGDFGIAVSTEMDDTGVRDNGMAIGLRYGMDMGGATVGFGIGYQTFTVGADWWPGNLGGLNVAHGVGMDVDVLGISANIASNGLSAGVEYTNFSIEGMSDDLTHVGVGVGYTTGAITVAVNYGTWDFGPWDVNGLGMSASYDLGGGASVHFGYGSSDLGGVGGPNYDNWSLGLAMSF
jgi:outer membrane protein OmpU